MKYVACYGDSLVQGFPFGPRYSVLSIVLRKFLQTS